jgi:hypothetical protein
MHVHICSSTTVANIQRGKVRFDFSEMFGPLFIKKNGDPLKNQPKPTSAAWAAFEEWHKEYRAALGKRDE